jgi:hypothetical protein
MSDAHSDTRSNDGADWSIGTRNEVAWITEGTSSGLAITAAIPPVFADYATLELPAQAADDEAREHDRAVVALLERYAVSTPWWLGYLETGSSDIIFTDVPRVTPYSGRLALCAGPGRTGTSSDLARRCLEGHRVA